MSTELAALRTLHDVCARMDLAQEAKRPTEAEYQAAMEAAAALIARASGSADQFERLRPDFERLANKNAACGMKRSRKGTYVNPAIARDWKWFQLGAIAITTGNAA